jgi:hypothetical protein
LKIRYVTASTADSREDSSTPSGTSYGKPPSRIVRLARTSLWAIVGSETRKARAISVVERPPTSLRVSATRLSAGKAG